MSDDDRCFCGAEWNDLAEECVEGHPFGEADKYRVRAEGLEKALRTVIEELVPRCVECDQQASWVEATFSGHDKHWCQEHVGIAQKAISKGANRYQPQRIRWPHWLEVAELALQPSSTATEKK